MHENLPRNMWPLGRILQVFPGKDSYVRSARVKMQNSILVSPVTKLCLLEMANLDSNV